MSVRLPAVVLLIVLVATTGCTRTRALSTAPSAGTLSEINQRAENSVAEVTLFTGEQAQAHRLHIAPDVATWVTEGGAVRSVPSSEIMAVEFESEGRGALEGLGLGVVIGAGSGALLGLIDQSNGSSDPSSGSDEFISFDLGSSFAVAGGIVLGGVWGGLVGLIAGGISKSSLVYAAPESAVGEEDPVASSRTDAVYRYLTDEEQARMLDRLGALREALRSEPGTEALQQDVAEAEGRAREGRLLRQELPKLVDLFRRYRID